MGNNARVVNALPTHSAGIAQQVTDAATGDALATATASLDGSDKTDQADMDGFCELGKLAPGSSAIIPLHNVWR